jgi:hypothetical protein
MNMYNPYAPNPYIQQGQQEDIGGLTPVFQNIAAQQANQNAAIQQGMGLTQQAGQGSQGGGMNPMAMAMALRNKKPQGPAQYTGPSYGTNPNFSNSHFDTMSYD